MVSLEQRLRAHFMLGVGITIEKQDRDCLDPEPLEHAAVAFDLAPLECQLNFAIGQHPFLDLESERPLHQRLVLLKEQIVRIRAG